MANRQVPSKEVLRQLLSYDPDTGKLFWKERGLEWFTDSAHSAAHTCRKWNSRMAGKEAFTATKSDGYRHGAIFGLGYSAHRVIWVWVTGKQPDQVDHINGIKSDNTWQNLRDVSASQNRRNAARHRDNKSGVTGVRRARFGNTWSKWQAYLQTKDEGFVNLGTFDTIEEAATARKAAEVAYGYHPNHGRKAKPKGT